MTSTTTPERETAAKTAVAARQKSGEKNKYYKITSAGIPRVSSGGPADCYRISKKVSIKVHYRQRKPTEPMSRWNNRYVREKKNKHNRKLLFCVIFKPGGAGEPVKPNKKTMTYVFVTFKTQARGG